MKTISVVCGIYETEYSLTPHSDGAITVTAPYVHWVNNSGNLAFKSVEFPAGTLAERIKQAFENGSLMLPGYECATLQDAIEGYLH